MVNIVKIFADDILKCFVFYLPRKWDLHYENTPIQIYRKFYNQEISDIFHISAQNLDCGYSLELPR